MTRIAMLLIAAGVFISPMSRKQDSNALSIPNYDFSQIGSFRLAPGHCAATSEVAGRPYHCRQAILLWRRPTPTGDITIEVWDERQTSSALAVTGVMDGDVLRVLSAYRPTEGQRPATGKCRFVGTMPPGYGPISLDAVPDAPNNGVAPSSPFDNMAPIDGEPDNIVEAPDMAGDNMAESFDTADNEMAPPLVQDTVTRFTCEATIDGRRVFYFDFTQRG